MFRGKFEQTKQGHNLVTIVKRRFYFSKTVLIMKKCICIGISNFKCTFNRNDKNHIMVLIDPSYLILFAAIRNHNSFDYQTSLNFQHFIKSGILNSILPFIYDTGIDLRQICIYMVYGYIVCTSFA